MKFITISPQLFKQIQHHLIRFTIQHSDHRITHQAIRWFKRLKSSNWKKGTMIMISLHNNKLVGLVVFGNYGIQESFCVVHPAYRNQGIGEKLLKHSLRQLNRVYTRVAIDNLPSLKVCFSCGLVAFRLIKGPTGKPTFLFGGGDWKADEIK